MTEHAVQNRVLRVGLEHEFDLPTMVEFENYTFSGVETILEFTSPITFCDYNVAADVITVKKLLSQESLEAELVNLGKIYQCQYIFYGSIDPQANDDHHLKAITCHFYLYDTKSKKHLMQTQYSFSQFKDKTPTIQNFTPDWDALNNMMRWLSNQFLAMIQPETSTHFYHNMLEFTLSTGFKEFKTMSKIRQHAPNRKSLSALVKLAQRTPQLALAHYQLAAQLKIHGYYKHAFLAFQNAWNLFVGLHDEKKSFCATEAGVCLALLGEKEKALSWWNMAIQIDPTNITPYINLALSLEEAAHYEKAEMYLKKALEVDANDLRVYDNLARLYSKQDQWEKAADIYKMLVRIEPNHPWHHSNLANSYLQFGQIDEAMTVLRRTVALDPSGEAGRCAMMILESLEAAAELSLDVPETAPTQSSQVNTTQDAMGSV